MSVTLTNANFMKNPMNLQMKREFEEYTAEGEGKLDQNDSNNSSDANSEMSDLENNNEETGNAALDYSENALSLQPVAEFIKKELLPEFDFGNPFRGQNLAFKDGFQNRSPFLLPTQLYKSFLASLGKRRRNVTECYSLYPRNMLFGSNGFGFEASDDENNADRTTDSPDEVFVVTFIFDTFQCLSKRPAMHR